MCLGQTDEYFFAISRDNGKLKEEMKKTLLGENNIKFEGPSGEFCAVLFDPNSNRLIFGRDLWGRKSFCWRFDTEKGIFGLSLCPGQGDLWHEVPPGTFVILKLLDSPIFKKNLNNKVLKFPSQIFDFEWENQKSLLSREIIVYSFYPQKQLELNQLFKNYKKLEFHRIESDLLLQPDQPQLQLMNLMAGCDEIQLVTKEFISRFFGAVRNILETVPLIGQLGNAGAFATLRVPVLFSGGVDSLMVALSAGEVLQQMAKEENDELSFEGEIALCTVAFGEKEGDCCEASDRQQSITAFEHLKERSLRRYGRNPYSLVLVNVTKEELVECRDNIIAHAIAPCRTVLDDSLGSVLWFATRLRGVKLGEENIGQMEEITTPFVLVGSGSDEQLGGYARHRTVFQSRGIDGLTAELSMEMHRIAERNFGRDDRVGMSNGKAILAPFLEEQLVRWLNKIPTAVKTGFSLSAGGNKFILRNSLRILEVPEQIVQRPKRAMQFGTRIAKLENAKGTKGNDLCPRLVPTASLNGEETINTN